MTTPSNPQEPFNPFLSATVTVPEEEDRRRTFLVDNFSNMADVINDKKIGCYTQATESFNGEKWIYDTTKKVRNGYQSIARITRYPNAGVLTLTLTSDPKFPIPNINEQFVITNVWGSASKPCSKVGAGDGDYFSFYTQGNAKVSFTMSDTQIVITTTVNLSAYSGFIVIEYLRDGV
jgi:hypothetical protein